MMFVGANINTNGFNLQIKRDENLKKDKKMKQTLSKIILKEENNDK